MNPSSPYLRSWPGLLVRCEEFQLTWKAGMVQGLECTEEKKRAAWL